MSRRIPEGTMVTILMTEPIDLTVFPAGHPWEPNGGWPSYTKFVVGDAFQFPNGAWSYKGPDGAGWHEDSLLPPPPLTTAQVLRKKLDTA